MTKVKAHGDLPGVLASFNINLSDYKVENMVPGKKVPEDIKITVTMVCSNAN
ncbi:hypothetical protein BMS3Abin03_01911 [bacterium BMS3Abin03]|nr:hypothetical protein BMS3Abin03_01911 [bacterium BMS3Abin03]